MNTVEILVRNVKHVYSPGTPYETTVDFPGEFRVKTGEIVLLTGKNGSGKTTILQISAVLLKPTSGEILIDGKDPWENPRNFRKKIGFSFQFPEDQFFEMDVFSEVTFAPKNFDVKDLEARYARAMEVVGLDPSKYRNKVPFNLSGGEKRKVALASIISHDPDVLILDEPFVGLDIPSRREILEFLTRWKNQGKGALISTHRTKAFLSVSDVVVKIGK